MKIQGGGHVRGLCQPPLGPVPADSTLARPLCGAISLSRHWLWQASSPDTEGLNRADLISVLVLPGSGRSLEKEMVINSDIRA